jgi:3D (Asp-Asp-Asp) domain-containing protein
VDSVEEIQSDGAEDREVEATQQRFSEEIYVITAYCACYDCCNKRPTDKGYGITASGVKAQQGITVAADTKVLPFGAKIYIEGVGERIVQDTGSAIKGKKIDLYFENHQEALNFGRQTKQVTIIN